MAIDEVAPKVLNGPSPKVLNGPAPKVLNGPVSKKDEKSRLGSKCIITECAPARYGHR